MNRSMFVALTVALLAVNPAASADGWRGQNGGHQNGGQMGGAPHGQTHGSNWHSPNYAGGSYHANGNYHGNYHGNYRGYPYAHVYHPYRGYYGYAPHYAGYYPARPYYYPYRPHYYRPVAYPYYGYHGGYYPYYQHHNNNNHSDWPAYVAGGLIVGALLTNAYNKSQANSYSNGYYSQQSAPTAAPVGTVQGRRLLRDINGNCYERQTDNAGNEMRTELPASECNW